MVVVVEIRTRTRNKTRFHLREEEKKETKIQSRGTTYTQKRQASAVVEKKETRAKD